MKPTEQDYDYLIDQLSNSMEFCESRVDFIVEVAAKTSFLPDDLGYIWNMYKCMNAKTSFDMNKYDWYNWINKLIN